jgi:hypothetical protein
LRDSATSEPLLFKVSIPIYHKPTMVINYIHHAKLDGFITGMILRCQPLRVGGSIGNFKKHVKQKNKYVISTG